jgi:hypothetical protein
MKINDIHVGYEETCSLPNYSNVRPSIRFSATVEEGEDPEQVRDQLLEKAKTAIRSEINEALKLNNCEPKYFQGDLDLSVQEPF